MNVPRLTVLMPLHRGRAWLKNITRNISLCPADCSIIISDITAEDDTLTRLTKRHRKDPRILFRQRKSELDWRHHINELFKLVETEFCSILPQDDFISDDYHAILIAALDGDQEAGLAFGLLAPLNYQASNETYFVSPPFELGVLPAWHDAISLDRQWNLGIPWRGVIRSKYLWSILITPHGFSDQLWVFGIALQTHLKEVQEAIYYKRYHVKNTHSSWEPLEGDQRQKLMIQIIYSQLEGDPEARQAALHHLRLETK